MNHEGQCGESRYVMLNSQIEYRLENRKPVELAVYRILKFRGEPGLDQAQSTISIYTYVLVCSDPLQIV